MVLSSPIILAYRRDRAPSTRAARHLVAAPVSAASLIVAWPQGPPRGRSAGANALSDAYAMGGRPVLALNLTAWPGGTLPLSILADVLRGGASVAAAAGCLVVGGHTIDDPEPKYGMAVVGFASPSRLFTIDAARPGDTLVLTK